MTPAPGPPPPTPGSMRPPRPTSSGSKRSPRTPRPSAAATCTSRTHTSSSKVPGDSWLASRPEAARSSTWSTSPTPTDGASPPSATGPATSALHWRSGTGPATSTVPCDRPSRTCSTPSSARSRGCRACSSSAPVDAVATASAPLSNTPASSRPCGTWPRPSTSTARPFSTTTSSSTPSRSPNPASLLPGPEHLRAGRRLSLVVDVTCDVAALPIVLPVYDCLHQLGRAVLRCRRRRSRSSPSTTFPPCSHRGKPAGSTSRPAVPYLPQLPDGDCRERCRRAFQSACSRDGSHHVRASDPAHRDRPLRRHGRRPAVPARPSSGQEAEVALWAALVSAPTPASTSLAPRTPAAGTRSDRDDLATALQPA